MKLGLYKLGDIEEKFAQLIWKHEPISSGELVKLCENELNWKKSTTYTVLKKLSEKGIFQNIKSEVTSLITRDEYYSMQSRYFVEDTFGGSLPKFLSAFFNGKKISEKKMKELERLIEEYDEVEK